MVRSREKISRQFGDFGEIRQILQSAERLFNDQAVCREYLKEFMNKFNQIGIV